MGLIQEYWNSICGFRSDCSNLIEKFSREDKSDFSTFVSLWRSHKFATIYEKYRHSCFDNNKFKEDTLQIAKELMLRTHFVGGLFLIFGLYYIQEDPKSFIRVGLNEFDTILNNLQEEKMSVLETFQPALIVAKLGHNRAFSFVRFGREYSFEGQGRARLINKGLRPAVSAETVQPIYWLKRKTEEIDILEHMSKGSEQCSQFKAQIKEEIPELNLALDMVPDDFCGGLQHFLTPGNTMVISSQLSEIGKKRQALKNRKMDVKHRYVKRKLEDEDPTKPSTSSSVTAVKQRCGIKRISYLKKMINESDDELLLSSEDSSSDERGSDLPEI